MQAKRIIILGSVASGKTILARKLGQLLSLPVIHIDSIEFNSDLTKNSIDKTRIEVRKAVIAAEWILDGHGPLDLLPEHLKNADAIIFLDFPLYRNLFWLLKRQILVLFRPRVELPRGANEWQFVHMKKMVQTLFKQHRLMNPELIRILQKPEFQSKVVHIKTIGELKKVNTCSKFK